MHTIQPVILCGGSGTRLWPLSRAGFPKQFLCLTADNSLFQQAVDRVNHLGASDIAISETVIVTNEEHRFLALDQLRELGHLSAALLLEPIGRNTAPALTLAALHASEGGNDPILVVTPADQTVMDSAAFTVALQQAIRAAADGTVVILGITPDRAETGYGYIQASPVSLSESARAVAAFVEKPDRATAEGYLASGDYYWNAGMFVLRASSWLKALATLQPAMEAAARLAWQQRQCEPQSRNHEAESRFIRPGKAEFAAIPADSIDYAVMERLTRHTDLPRLAMIPLAAGWSDLGAWDAVWQVSERDGNGNACHGDTLVIESHNTLVHASSRLVGVVGVENLVVVETADAVLVSDKRHAQEVKQLVNVLNRQQREEHTLHRKVHRPWGWYDSIDEEERFKVKRIQVKPKASLSLQKHYHRAEHWIVVKGTAEITCGDRTIILTENQSTYIPLGEVHRLANPGTIPLEIIEVQSGSYLGEDDIVRFEDHYGRGSTHC
jgi:mannose-1-phosphate guanylyltransferase / mannose-6-phosphate isomerase